MIIPKGTVVTIDGKVYRTLEAQVAWNKEELESLDIETLEGLPDAFEELDNKVDGIDDRLETAEGDIVDIKGDVQDLDQDINGTGGIEDRLTTAEENIGSSAGDISQLQYDLDQAEGDIAGLGTQLAGKLDKPTNTGDVGDVIVKTAGGTEFQSVAPFNPAGDYPGVSVGKSRVAKQIENVSEDSGSNQTDPFFFQGTATENNTGSTPSSTVAELKEIRGNTICYNQLVDGVNTTYQTISGHKYWCYISATDYTSIITSSGNTINISDAQKDYIVDLTLWFNGNIPSAITDDALAFPGNYWNGSLSYNAGTLVSSDAEELETIGFNQFDVANHPFENKDRVGSTTSYNVWEQGFIPIIPNTEYGLYHDSFNVQGQYVAYYTDEDESSFISSVSEYSSDNFTFTTPKNARFCRFGFYHGNGLTAEYISSKNPFIFEYWDGERTAFEPFVKHTYTVGDDFSGKSAGSAYDSKDPDGTIHTRIGSVTITNDVVNPVDLSNGIFDIVVNDGYKPVTNDRNKFVSSNVFVPSTNNGTGSMDEISVLLVDNSSTPMLFFKDSSCTTVSAFTTKYAGTVIYYRLSTETTSSGTPYTDTIEIDDYGTMLFSKNGAIVSVPMGNEIFYPADYVLLLDDLNNYVNGDVTELAKKSDLIQAPTGGDGTYVFKATVSGGAVTYFWEAES